MGNTLNSIHQPLPVPPQWINGYGGRKIPNAPSRRIEIVHNPSHEVQYNPTDTDNVTQRTGIVDFMRRGNARIGFEIARDKCERYEALMRVYNDAMRHYSVSFPHDYHRMLQSWGPSTDSHVALMLSRLNMYKPEFESHVLLITQCVWSLAMQYPGMQTTLPEKDRWMLSISKVLSKLAGWDEPEPDADEEPDTDTDTDKQYDTVDKYDGVDDIDKHNDVNDVAALAEIQAEWAKKQAKEEAKRDKTYAGKFYAIHRTKMAYINCVNEDRKKAGIDVNLPVCSVLTCWNRSGAFIMNSMNYCADHHGMAIFNGLRHANGVDFCDACGLWNVLGLKYTCNDWNHVHYHVRNMQIPLKKENTSTHNRQNVKITWFKKPGMTFDYWSADEFMVYSEQYPTRHTLVKMTGTVPRYFYHNSRGKSLLVPDGALAFVNRHKIVDAWILVIGTDLRTNKPVARMKGEDIDYIFKKIRNGNPLLRNLDVIPDDNCTGWGTCDTGWGQGEEENLSRNNDIAPPHDEETWDIDYDGYIQ